MSRSTCSRSAGGAMAAAIRMLLAGDDSASRRFELMQQDMDRLSHGVITTHRVQSVDSVAWGPQEPNFNSAQGRRR
jgi:hypothetical protein